MNSLKKVNNKTIAMCIAFGFTSFLSYQLNNYIGINNEIANTSQEITNYRNQTSVINSNLTNKSGKLASNTDLSFYAGNIYAYALLEDIQLDIRNGESKYKNTISMNLTYQEFKDKQKFKDFLQALSYLGYIENVGNKNLTLHVTNFTLEDAKKLIISHKE